MDDAAVPASTTSKRKVSSAKATVATAERRLAEVGTVRKDENIFFFLFFFNGLRWS